MQVMLVGGHSNGDIVALDELTEEIVVRRFRGSRPVAVSPSGETVSLDRYSHGQRYQRCPLGPEMPVYEAV
jgi:hypothetical protein